MIGGEKLNTLCTQAPASVHPLSYAPFATLSPSEIDSRTGQIMCCKLCSDIYEGKRPRIIYIHEYETYTVPIEPRTTEVLANTWYPVLVANSD
jgi:hypothetical protein